MTSKGITIVVPVGPDPAYIEFLPECAESILRQMNSLDELFFINDMNSRLESWYSSCWDDGLFANHSGLKSIHTNEWRLGCAASWNIGVALARNENVILMGSDDKLMDGCLDSCRNTIESPGYDPLGYYNLTIQLDNGETHDVFNNAAMVSKTLWKHTGGFPLAAAIGAPDALLISIMLKHMPEHLHQIRQGHPLYWVRTGEHQDTRHFAAFYNWEVIQIRDKETGRWTPPEWTKTLDEVS